MKQVMSEAGLSLFIKYGKTIMKASTMDSKIFFKENLLSTAVDSFISENETF